MDEDEDEEDDEKNVDDEDEKEKEDDDDDGLCHSLDEGEDEICMRTRTFVACCSTEPLMMEVAVQRSSPISRTRPSVRPQDMMARRGVLTMRNMGHLKD